MLIQRVTTPLLMNIISITLTILYILVIVKLITMAMNVSKGLGGGSGGSGKTGKDKADKTSKEKTPKNNPKDIGKAQDKYEDFMKENGLDPEKKTRVRFRVVDSNGNPLMRVGIQVWPLIKNKKAPGYKKFKNYLKKSTLDFTLPDGFTPNAIPLAVGAWEGKAVKIHYSVGQVFNNLRKDFLWRAKSKGTKFRLEVVELPNNEEDVRIIVMIRDVESGNNPRILSVRQINKPKERFDKLELIGEISK